MADDGRPRRRIIRKFRIDHIAPEDPSYPGHQLVSEGFARRIEAMAGRQMTYLQAERVFGVVAPEYWRHIGRRGRRVRGRGSNKRRWADKFIHMHLSYVVNTVPARLRLPITGANSLAEAMAIAFDCGGREIEIAWSRRAIRKKRLKR